MATTFSHLGICVSDLERSLRFYCEALGFLAGRVAHAWVRSSAASWSSTAWRSTHSSFAATAIAIELLHFTSPDQIGRTPSAVP